MPEQSSRTFRTAFEVAVISLVIFVLLGAPGTSSFSSSSSTTNHHQEKNPPAVHAPTKLENLVYPDKNLQCPRHEYITHIFSTAPLMVYIEDFLSEEEVEHLIELSTSNWTPSTIFHANHESTNPSIRNSEKAAIHRSPTVQCIERRALAFQGWPKDTFIERLWTQRYNVSGHYSLHYDWASASRGARRVSSFMVYLRDECVGGGTHFPRMERPGGGSSSSAAGRGSGSSEGVEWCEFIKCGLEDDDDGAETGVTFQPRRGSAVFWMNFDAEGRGFKETIHAGMPVVEGQKIGLNIWSWYQAGHTPPEN